MRYQINLLHGAWLTIFPFVNTHVITRISVLKHKVKGFT